MKSTMQGQGGDDDGMDELYSTPKSNPGTIDDQEKEEMNTTAAVPLKVLQGKSQDAPKVGDEIVVKIKSIDNDQALIEYSETKPSEIGEGEGYEGPEYQSADDELEELGKKY